jgi:hypothetical protein
MRPAPSSESASRASSMYISALLNEAYASPIEVTWSVAAAAP